MKRIIMLVLGMLIILDFTATAVVYDESQKSEYEYISENTFYEILYETGEAVIFETEDGTSAIYVEVTTVFSGTIIPPATLKDTRTVSGTTYSGVLNLTEYSWESGQTYANYAGTLYEEY
ncbi:MAG: hypothetical protein LUG83_03540 [Lachnospiraceae bacterium]|nr:hypothetical protein [Lachnospiraceae bacterium]